MDKNQLDGLLALKLVAARRNFSAAAADLGVSPPAVTKMIKQLERRLGVALLSRTTRSTHLTEAGERFLAEAGPALDQILLAMSSARAYAEKPSGFLRLNLLRSIYQPFLADIIASFRRKYPDIAVELYFEDRASDVVESGFDAGIRLAEILEKDMVCMKLYGPVKYVVAAAPAYLKRAGRPKHPRDLLQHDCIVYRLEGGGLYDRWEFENKGKEFRVAVRPGLVMNDSTLAVHAAVRGSGYIYVAEEVIREDLGARRLEAVLTDFASDSEGYYIYYPRRNQVLPKLRAFIDHLREAGR